MMSDPAKKLASMWLGTHYADAHDAADIEALCWEILGADDQTKEAFRTGWSEQDLDPALVDPIDPKEWE